MSWVNYDYVIEQLVDANLDLTGDSHKRQIEFSGRIQRWRVSGEDREFRGWTKLREWRSPATGNLWIVGSYGIWRGTDDGFTKIQLSRDGDDKAAVPDADELKAIRAAQKEAQKRLEAERKVEAKTAARWAAQVWAHCAPATEHEYLTRKRVGAHGARIMGKPEGLALNGVDDSNWYRLTQAEGALVVPMHDEHANVCGIQFIYPKGHARAKKIERDKEFWPSGMAMGGTFGLIGPLRRAGVLLLGEGFATAATLHEATGQSVAYAFSANNLGKAGKLIRKTCPAIKLLFCADDDYTTGDAGAKCAAQAVAEIEGSDWCKPDFTIDGQDPRNGKKLTDFNDLFMLTGLHLVVASQINAKLDALKWRDPINSVNAGGQKPPSPPAGSGGSNHRGGGGNDRSEAVSILSLDEAVERFIFIDDDTGEYVFDTLTRNVVKRSKIIKMLAAGAREDDLKRHPRWQQRAVFIDQIGFDPGGEDKNIICNRWSGWPTVPARGSCDLLLELLQHQCSGEGAVARELYEWVLKWLAYPLQHPGAKMHTAIIMHGPQGSGKGRFFETYAKIFGEYGLVLNQEALEDKFNADWQERKLFILADEIVARAEMYHIKNRLKNFVTGEWVRVNPKNVAAHRERNHMQIVFLSNEKQPLVLENDDRRYCVIWTPPPVGKDFYDALSAEIETGGIAALHWYLLNEIELGDFKPWTRPPMTEAKRELIDISRDSVDRFLIDWQDGHIDGLPFCPCGSADLYQAYQGYCKINGERMPRPENQFSGHIIKLPGWFKGNRDVHADLYFSSTAKTRRMVIPPDELLARGRGADYRRPEGKPQAHWLTECYLAFHEALKGDRGPP